VDKSGGTGGNGGGHPGNTASVMNTVAGNGVSGSIGVDGPAVLAELNSLYGVSADAGDNFYVADYNSMRIRQIR
jgi:hypothetical protein